MYEGKIPFDEHASPVPYVVGKVTNYQWMENLPFSAILDFVRFERGHSAAHAIYARADDPSWEALMFLTDLEAVIERGLAPLRLKGTFEFVKRGQNYGIKLAHITAGV